MQNGKGTGIAHDDHRDRSVRSIASLEDLEGPPQGDLLKGKVLRDLVLLRRDHYKRPCEDTYAENREIPIGSADAAFLHPRVL